MILFVDQFAEMGGAQTVLLSLLAAALEVDDAVTVLAPGGGVLEAQIARRFGASVTFMACEAPQLQRGKKGLGDILALLGYGWRFRKHAQLLRRADLVWVNGSRQLPVLLALSPLVRRAVYHIHTDFGRLEKFSIRLAARWPNTSAMVSNSAFIAGRLGAPSTVIENALDERFAGLAFADRFDGHGAPFRAAVVGTLAPQKGQDVALHAIRGLPFTLSLIGAPAPGAAAFAAALQQDGARLEGVTADVPAAMARLNVQFNLVPSVCEEAFGLAAIEGMACSAITIVSGRGGLAQIAQHTGAFVAADPGALAALLGRLAALSPAELAAIARRQHDATLRHYGPARFLHQIAALIRAARTAK